MIEISKIFVSYDCTELQKRVEHFVLIHETKKLSTLLSYPNLFLYSRTRNSLKTSSRYASIISMFYRYLSTTEDFQNIHPGHYHIHVQNKNIKRWQTHRETVRNKEQSARPSTKTIFDEAKLLLQYFAWLKKKQIATLVDIQLKTWIPPFKSARYQQYVSYKARQVLDSSSIAVLDKDNRQSSFSNQLISPEEIKQLMESYSDPVYAALFLFALNTAMRPMDLCRFPYFGNGANAHIMPFSSMTFPSPTVNYNIYLSKGKKSREISIHKDALKSLEDDYIKPFYSDRAKKYEKNYGSKPPFSLLFITKDGHPVTPDRISSRTVAAREKALTKNPNLRKSLCFYDSRDWWPTQYVIRSIGDGLLKSNEILFNKAHEQILQAQMGHKFIQTTFDHYVGMARVILSMHQGRKLEIFKASNFTATDVLEVIQG